MSAIPDRAPIDYRDLRTPYNVVRAAGGATFTALLVVWVTVVDQPSALVLALPALGVVLDAAYRMRHPYTTPFVGLVIDATAIGIALTLHGPDIGILAVAATTLLVSSMIMLSPIRSLAVVGYVAVIAAAITLLDAAGAPFVSVAGPEGTHDLLDVAIVSIFLGATAAVLLMAVRVILRSQDRMAEALAQERRAVQLKNEFVSMVSHELRTPLTGIAGFTETLSDTWTTLPSREVDEFLAIMGHETEHLANLVEDILVIPRLEAGQLRLHPEELDLSVETHAVAGVVMPETDYSVSIPSGVLVIADRTRLRQIMRNLLENALKYGGDQVLIEGEMSSPGMYTVSVSDNGSGVDADDRERIFLHFEQLSTGDARLQQGVGLGLPIARKLARAMGGDLWYEDRFPVGAKFRFSVRMATGDEAPTADAYEGSRVPGLDSRVETRSS